MYEAGAKFTSESTENFKQKYIASRIEPRVLSGEISHPQYLQELRIILGNNSLTEGQLAKIVRKSWGNQINETIKLKKRLSEEGYSVGIFSNANKFAIDIFSKEFPEMFETYNTGPKIYSYQVGATKKDNLMFEKVQKMGFNNITYIDDNKPYVRKALEFGWNGILFTPYIDSAEAVRQSETFHISHPPIKFKQADNIEQLKQALNEFGISLK